MSARGGPVSRVSLAARAFALAGLRLSLLFAFVFYGVDAFTATRSDLWRLHMAWELSIPYWPAAYPLYLSALVMPFVVAVKVRDARAIGLWERRMALAIVLAALVYLLLPGQLAYESAPAGAWQPLADATRQMAGRHNLLPSLHVALTLVIVLAVWPHCTLRDRALVALWAVALGASTLLTHQHHVLDVLAGAVLGAFAGRAPLRR